MTNYNRRFTKEEFKQELAQHLTDMPPGHFQSKKHLEEHASIKAEHYARALEALDDAAAKLKSIADSHPDDGARQDADAALNKINEAIGAYGEASMSQNSKWNESTDS